MDDRTLSPREEILRLEARIDDLAARIENCRKFVIAARAAMVFGVLVLVALVLGVIRFNPIAMVAAIAALLGGIVLSGSNASTQKQAEAELAAAEARRAEAIGGIDLQVVGE
jgi:hypothetical protein